MVIQHEANLPAVRHGAFVLRSYSPGDEVAIEALFTKAFNRPAPPGLWVWRFLHNPAGRGIIELAWHGDRLAAHYALSPVRATGPYGPLKAALSGTTMTDPSFQRQGLFAALAKRAYERAVSQGIELVYGFPNQNSIEGFQRKLGWSHVADIESWEKHLRGSPNVVTSEDELPTPIRCNPSTAGAHHETDQLIMVVRDQAYLQWRYAYCPLGQYDIIEMAPSTVASPAYLVGSVHQDRYQVVDLIGHRPEHITHVVALAEQRAVVLGARTTAIWPTMGQQAEAWLAEEGFRPSGRTTHFGARTLPAALAKRPAGDPTKVGNWYLTMGDSDVY